ncbi:beta-glucanase/beta-glucan synthetase [Mycobacterium dioxanotrophicus]|uniref:Beta-glucanase/beta-glucan synthetase n=1 Tax=Mycobacterium dioxanotrophicus TaxID=482462 RepID=A0A1Y0CBL4_9MYCO|nr:beta-glucanase/beta-glucan synthetase [Mycobacterium dioxanotrophicus]
MSRRPKSDYVSNNSALRRRATFSRLSPYCLFVHTRPRLAIAQAVAVLMLAACTNASGGDATPRPASPPPPSPSDVFDGFDGPAGSRPNTKFWSYDLGNLSPDNHELQTYTDATANIRHDGNGHLIVQALKTPTGYTSGRLITQGKIPILYGTVSARIKFPSGQGIWPAFWLLGSDIDTVGWPQCGEIDVMELVNTGTTYNVTLHGPQGKSDYSTNGLSKTGLITDLSKDFHVYWVTRQPDSITIGVDGTALADFTPSSLPEGATWVFNKPMYAVLNVAVGGDWPGPPDQSTHFPATMLIDWFRYTR